jgi:outer membrane protein OmpA-like peptidoglycan-associated protein
MAPSVWAQGLNSAAFLRVSPFARQVGMGEAFTGMANDVNLLRYNVGGLGNLRFRALSTSYHSWIDDTYQGALEVAWPTVIRGKRVGVVGFNLTYFNEGELTELDENFKPTGSVLSSSDLILSFGYGMSTKLLNINWAIGAGPKFARQNLAGQSANAIGLDIGTVVTYKELSFGATFQNFTISKMKFINREQALPETIRGGVAFRLPLNKHGKIKVTAKGDTLDHRTKLNLAVDAAKLLDDDTWRFYTGVELRLAETVALRGGYKIHDDELARWSAGIGFILPIKSLAKASTQIDYAYSPADAFDSQTHRFSLSFNFGAAPDEGVFAMDTTGFAENQRRIREQLAEAERARQEMEASQQRIAQMEEEWKRRLEELKKLAGASGGTIGVSEIEPGSVLVTLRHINFDFDKSDIRPTERETLKTMAKILDSLYYDSKVSISGHADSIGTYAYNYNLSMRRLNSVMDYLEDKHNISRDRFFMPVNYGENRPLEDNGSAWGRAQNRRVEFLIHRAGEQPSMPEASMLENLATVENALFGLKFNGQVKFTETSMSNPDRLVIDLPDIYLPGEFQSLNINRGDFISIRAAFHEEDNFTRVVFDLRRPVKLELTAQNGRLVIKDQDMILPQAVKQ